MKKKWNIDHGTWKYGIMEHGMWDIPGRDFPILIVVPIALNLY